MDFILAYFLQKIIPYLGFFPYKEILADYHLPSFISSFANFDGVHYLILAKQGYSQYEHAFFPLYPLLIKLLTPVFFGNALLTGLIISNVSFLLGLIFFYKYLNLVLVGDERSLDFARDKRESGALARRSLSEGGRQNLPAWIVVFLLLFPTSFFFSSLYTEGLFFLLFIGSLYFLKKEKYIPAAIFAFLASFTRLIGVFLVIPFVFHVIKSQNSNLKTQISKLKSLIIIFSPILGLFLYGFYLWITTGDPLAFFSSQPAFGANRSTKLILLPQVYYRYLKIFLTATPDFRYWVSVFEFVIFNFVLITLLINLYSLIKKVKLAFFFDLGGADRAELGSTPTGEKKMSTNLYDLMGLSLFSIINLVLPTLTGTLSSIPRYALFSLSFYIALAQIKSTAVKILIAIIFAILHFVALGLFIQGYFIA